MCQKYSRRRPMRELRFAFGRNSLETTLSESYFAIVPGKREKLPLPTKTWKTLWKPETNAFHLSFPWLSFGVCAWVWVCVFLSGCLSVCVCVCRPSNRSLSILIPHFYLTLTWFHFSVYLSLSFFLFLCFSVLFLFTFLFYTLCHLIIYLNTLCVSF